MLLETPARERANRADLEWLRSDLRARTELRRVCRLSVPPLSPLHLARIDRAEALARGGFPLQSHGRRAGGAVGVVAMLGGIGVPELIVFSLIALLLFGNRLPSVMRSVGKGIFEFKDALQNPDRNLTDQDA